MSGGMFNYRNDYVCDDIFGYGPDYNLEGLKDLKDARRHIRRDNPFDDVEISELIFDVFCLIHSYDWYVSGDTNEDTYRKDVEYFKRKWFGKTVKQRADKVAQDAIEEFSETIKRVLGTINADNS